MKNFGGHEAAARTAAAIEPNMKPRGLKAGTAETETTVEIRQHPSTK